MAKIALTPRMMAFGDCAVATVGLLAIIVATSKSIAAEWQGQIGAIVWIATVLFAIEIHLCAEFVRAAGVPWMTGWVRAVTGYLRTPAGSIDLMAVLAIPIPTLLGLNDESARLFGLVWVLKYARYSSGLVLLGRVMRNAADSLLSVLLGFVIVLIAAANAMYLLEGESQPDQFGSIPLAMWWAIVTLTTTGYGDVTPLTVLGRMLGGIVMVCGIAMFGLMAGILASGFADELRRREFLQTWDLVARVPFFHDLGADKIAAVARLLKRREMSAGQVVMRRGQPGEAMYFVVEGEVEVDLVSGPVRLAHGKFFGEMALITGEPRSVTVTAKETCLLLELDVADFRQLAGDSPELLRAIADEAARRRG